MQIEIFCLCKAAPANEQMQPSVIDIFDSVFAKGEPALFGAFLVALCVRIYREDTGQHSFSVSCKDKSGKVFLGPIRDIVDISRPSIESTMFFTSYGVPAGPWRLGTYEFSIEIDGKQCARTPLYVLPENTLRYEPLET